MNRYLIVPVVTLIFAGCSDGDRSKESFARVNGTRVTYGQLELTKAKFGVDETVIASQAEAEQRIKEMLISSRAMALLAEKTLSDEETSELETRVAMYREELLVKKYLEAHAKPEPVSADTVKAYYDTHPNEFGGGKEKGFEVLSTARQPTGKDRDAILRQFAAASQSHDWSGIARNLSSQGVSFRRGRSRPELLDEPLRQLASETAVGKVSNVYVGDRMMIIRVTDEKMLSPKPLMEVSAEIRKKLAPSKLKEAIKVVSDEALKQVNISYDE